MSSSLELLKDLDLLMVMRDCGVDVRKATFSHIRCPFKAHGATGCTPSFKVYLDTNSFFCWGCKVSGSTIDFTMSFYGKSFKEAIEYLEEKYDIDVRGSLSRRFLFNKSDRIFSSLDIVKGVNDLMSQKHSKIDIFDFIQRFIFCERADQI